MTELSPAETLTAAAQLLRDRSAGATPGPWTWLRWHSDCPANCDNPSCFLLIVGSPHGLVGDADVDRPDVFAVERSVQERGEDDAAWIALMHPGVGLALADWLDTAVANAAALTWPSQFIEAALTVARQILGEVTQ